MTRFAVVLVMIAWPLTSSAQPAGAQAEVLFRQGRDLMAAGKFAEACSAFAESQKLELAVTTLLNLGGCREKNNQLASAWGLFLDAERQTRSGTDAATQQLHGVAEDHAQKLEPRLSTLIITVASESRVEGLEILRDGEVVDVGTWNKALPIDGGTYKISARAPGNAEWSTTVTVGVERDVKAIDVPKLKAAEPGPAQPTPSAPLPIPEAPSPVPVPVTNASSKLVPVVISAGALALLGGALGCELWGNSTYNNAKVEMTDQARRDSLYDSANTKRYVAEGLAVGGVAAAAAAVWLYLRHHDDESPKATARLVIAPTGIAFVRGF